MSLLPPHETSFLPRHIGSSEEDLQLMLATLGYESLDALTDAVIPADIRLGRPLAIPEGRSEPEVLDRLRAMGAANGTLRSLQGTGYAAAHLPPVIQRNVLENPGWYTQYTPYQAEIAQGRLEALLLFQTLFADLTGLPLSNASLLDEATAAVEAMVLCRAGSRDGRTSYFVDELAHPQTIAVLQTRATAVGIELIVAPRSHMERHVDACFGVFTQCPDTTGTVFDLTEITSLAHAHGARAVVATDPLAALLLPAPGSQGADVVFGSSQRFGMPMGFGGPHAAFFTAVDDLKRFLPGRIVGVSRDADGQLAYRLALQTREQHIRRERATSNICTAQVLPAVVAAFYAVYHGPDGLRRIAERVHGQAERARAVLRSAGVAVQEGPIFDTVRLLPAPEQGLRLAQAENAGFQLRSYTDGSLAITFDERSTDEETQRLLAALLGVDSSSAQWSAVAPSSSLPRRREDPILATAQFHLYHQEHELLRYLHRLQSRDLSLTTSMIPLGSCTMKLNGSTSMQALTWGAFADVHPHTPPQRVTGYATLISELSQWLGEVTGLPHVSVQPNSGAQGEYAGLLAIAAYHRARGESQRKVCLIPVSAHGTNPASSVVAGFEVVPVACDERGNIDLSDLQQKAATHAARLGALMVTYPSTHGVFEGGIGEICRIVHDHGGQVYLDGANLNAQVGLARPGDYGADVCHINLHKTFAIPHGGGGPGVGPIAVKPHLAPYLPSDPLTQRQGGAVSAAAFGSALALTISWAYVALMGGHGLKLASQVAVLNANYIAHRVRDHYGIVYTGNENLVAHELILDARGMKKAAGVEVEDIAKRLIDYGFHAPTMSWPVAGTLMIEPTESESKAELDRFCEALISIRQEIAQIEQGLWAVSDSPLRHAPHTASCVTQDHWPHSYSRTQAAYPLPYLRDHKFWPYVRRVDNAFGDRNLTCCLANGLSC